MTIPPAGLSPLAAFAIERHEATPAPVPILADAIDPVTGDFASLVESASIADAMVVTLLRTQRGSGAAVLNLGQRFAELRHVTSESPEVLESMAREALQPAVAAGVATLVGIDAEVATDGTQINAGFRYVDRLAERDGERVFRLTE